MNRVQISRKNSNKIGNKTIGLIIPTTTGDGKIINLDDLVFFQIFLPSFLKYASNTHYYNFFLGHDHDDPFFSDPENREQFRKKFEDSCPKIYTLTFIKFDKEIEKGDLSTMWSILADKAVKTNEYLYQLGDDIEFKSKGWEDLFITLLAKQNNIGAVGPKDEGNITGILTQSFVHCTHLSIFNRYFPKELKNWYIDDWISEIYDTRVERRIIVQNKSRKPRYSISNDKDKKILLVTDHKKLINSLKTSGKFPNININDLKKKPDISQEIVDNYNSRSVSVKLNDIWYYKTKNYIQEKDDQGNITINNNENRLLEPVNDKIYLFQQFYIPSSEQRYLEIKDTLSRNVKLKCFEKIYLLNERIYTQDELGVDDNNVICQIVIGKRLSFQDFFNNVGDLSGFVVLSNSDIFFDKTINNIRRSIIREIKSVQCLRRYEFDEKEKLGSCKLFHDEKSSQDTWIFHTKYIKTPSDCDFNLGTAGCDNTFGYKLFMEGYIILSSIGLLRTYHNHNCGYRNYDKVKTTHKPYIYIQSSQESDDSIIDLKGVMWNVDNKYDFRDIGNKTIQKNKQIIGMIRNYHPEKIIRIKNESCFFYATERDLIFINPSFTSYDLGIDKNFNLKNIEEIIGKIKGPSIYIDYEGKRIRKLKNYVLCKTEKGINIVKNVNNCTRKHCENKIFLIQQYFIPDRKDRQKQIKECLRRNINLNLFDKIYLLNEKIYTSNELGLETIPDNLIQVNIINRLTFKVAFDFGKRLDGFIVLSNSDIFFDKTIIECRNLEMSDYKCIQSLCRYEFRDHDDLSKCPPNNNMIGSQDTWIIHSSQIGDTSELDFYLGKPGCDPALNHIFLSQGALLLNDNHIIKTYHYHPDEYRTYYKTLGRLEKPNILLFRDGYVGSCTKLFLEYNLFWQYPVITEKRFFEQNYQMNEYVGIPWASILDKKIDVGNMDLFIEKINSLVSKKNRYTCCQHIRFRDLIYIFKKLDIRKVYVPHKIIGEDKIDGIKLFPCPLYAKVVEDNRDYINSNINRERKILYSFQGGYQSCYMSNVRKDIFSMKHPENTFIKNTGRWHFNKIVYSEKQNSSGDFETTSEHESNEASFIELMLDSRFTLCPSGSGPNSIRFWEALGTGSIPILLSDKLQLPEHPLMMESIIIVEEKEIKKIPNILSKIGKEKEIKMRANCLEIYNDFRENYVLAKK